MVKALCRKGLIVRIPCNWNKDGFCGDDTKHCILLRLVEGNINEI